MKLMGLLMAFLLVGSTAQAAESFLVVERAVSDTTVDLGKKGDSLGDLIVFANPIYDAANRQQIGSNQGYCIRVIVGKSWECFWTIELKEGQITSEGPFHDEGDALMAITGGAGRYAGAKGSLGLHPRDAKGTEYDFRYDLL